MDSIKEFLPFLIPYLIVLLIIIVVSVRHVITHPNYRFGNKIMWLLIVCLLQIIGPIIYFAFGKEED